MQKDVLYYSDLHTCWVHGTRRAALMRRCGHFWARMFVCSGMCAQFVVGLSIEKRGLGIERRASSFRNTEKSEYKQ